MIRIIAEITIRCVREVEDDLTDEQLELEGENLCRDMGLSAECFGDDYGITAIANSGADVVDVE